MCLLLMHLKYCKRKKLKEKDSFQNDYVIVTVEWWKNSKIEFIIVVLISFYKFLHPIIITKRNEKKVCEFSRRLHQCQMSRNWQFNSVKLMIEISFLLLLQIKLQSRDNRETHHHPFTVSSTEYTTIYTTLFFIFFILNPFNDPRWKLFFLFIFTDQIHFTG